MGVTPTEAAEIARRHGLTLQDAAGLAALANSTEEAEQLAARFRTPETEYRSFIKALFEPPPESPIERLFARKGTGDTSGKGTS